MKNIVTYIPLILKDLAENDIGRPVSHQQKTDREYGIITNFDEQFVYVHFNNGNESIMLLPKHLFLTQIKIKK